MRQTCFATALLSFFALASLAALGWYFNVGTIMTQCGAATGSSSSSSSGSSNSNSHAAPATLHADDPSTAKDCTIITFAYVGGLYLEFMTLLLSGICACFCGTFASSTEPSSDDDDDDGEQTSTEEEEEDAEQGRLLLPRTMAR